MRGCLGPQLGRVALDVVPPAREAEERIRAGEDQRPGSLRSCCRENNGRKSAVIHAEKSGALPKPTASMTASISVDRSSTVRTCGTGSDSPTPTLSNTTTRQNLASWSKKALNSGMVQNSSMWVTNGPTKTSSIGPSPNTWYARLRSPQDAYAVSATA